MLKIQPEDEIVFSKIENGMIGGEIEILNSSTNTIAFKVIVIYIHDGIFMKFI